MTDTHQPAMGIEPERYELREPLPYRFTPSRRVFLKSILGGLSVVLLASGRGRSAKAETNGGQGPGAVPLSAWIHVAEDGGVQLFTGKTEIGQDLRTSFSQVLLEELSVPLEQLEIVLGDTSICPYDRGTFGSMSTPQVAPQVRKVGATTRQVLLDMAADTWSVDSSALQLVDGQIVHNDSGQQISIGDLVAGKDLTAEVDDRIATVPASDWQIAGTSMEKRAAHAMVTGRHRFTSDLRPEGVQFARILRAPTFDAQLERVDLSAAEAMPGIIAVQDGGFVGVCGPDPQRAEQALAAIEADWSEQRSPANPADLDRQLRTRPRVGDGPEPHVQTVGLGIGGLDTANTIVSATYTLPYVAHVPLEPRAAVATWSDAGPHKIDAFVATQTPFRAQEDLAEAFGLDPEQVRVRVPDTGSGYGGKTSVSTGLEAARLAQASGAPVHLRWTREEEFTWAYFRPPASIDTRLGLDTHGKIVAWSQTTYNAGSTSLACNYSAAHQHLQFSPGSPPLRQGSYRAVGSTANQFAAESAVDEAARAMGADPLEYRLAQLNDARLKGVLERAAEQFGWGKNKGEGRGQGIAVCKDKGGYIANAVEVAVDDDGRFRLLRIVAAADVGALINPAVVHGQIEGSILMGIGAALFEETKYSEGKIDNPRLALYRVPRFSDIPEIEVLLDDDATQNSAGSGEVGIVAIAPAIANAIDDACGKRLRGLPLVPDGRVEV